MHNKFSKLQRTFKDNPSLCFSLLILSFILFWYGCKFRLTFIGSLLLIPNERNVRDEFLDILDPAILLFLSSFFVFQDFRVSMSNIYGRSNINIPLLKKLIIFLLSFIFFPIVKYFIGSAINGTVIDIVGYSSSYFPYFEGVLFPIPLLVICVCICCCFNVLVLFFLFFSYMSNLNGLSEFNFRNLSIFILTGFSKGSHEKHTLKVSLFGRIRIFVFLMLIFINISLFFSFKNGVEFILSGKDGDKEIKELLLVTSYNEIPARCRYLLNVYGGKEKALLSFIDENLASIYIVDDDVFINESCK